MDRNELVISMALEQEIKARLRLARDVAKWNREDMIDEFTAMIDKVMKE